MPLGDCTVESLCTARLYFRENLKAHSFQVFEISKTFKFNKMF